MKLLLIHGRSQQGKDPDILCDTWADAFRKGCAANGDSLPDALNIGFPFYGDVLDDFAKSLDAPVGDDYITRGPTDMSADYDKFRAEMAMEIQQGQGITDADVEQEFKDTQKPKGPRNWEWVQAILRTIDRKIGGASEKTVELFTRDVFLYLTAEPVRDAVNDIVRRHMTASEPMIVVSHSLGTVVSYDILNNDNGQLNVPLFATIGSPLGLEAIKKRIPPLRQPACCNNWFNAFDQRDVVALYPLNSKHFGGVTSIDNYDKVKNHTKNRHGIIGYLDDKKVAKELFIAINQAMLVT